MQERGTAWITKDDSLDTQNHPCRPLVSRRMKTGAPSNAVRMPRGCRYARQCGTRHPREQIATAHDEGDREQGREARSNEHACHVRHEKANPCHNPTDAHHRRSQRSGHDEQSAYASDTHAQGARFVVAQGQDVELPAQGPDQRHGDEDWTSHVQHVSACHSAKPAHQPERNHWEHVNRISDVLEHGNQRLEEC